MGFFSRFFGKQATSVQNTNVPLREQQRQSGINYDPELIPKLKEDHQALVKVYTDILNTYNTGNYALIPAMLNDLKLGLQTHIMLENVKFYVYLQQNWTDDAEIASFVADVRREMDTIARTAVKFVSKYNTPGAISAATATAFKEEFDTIGTVLTKRIQLEETRLYTLYMPR